MKYLIITIYDIHSQSFFHDVRWIRSRCINTFAREIAHIIYLQSQCKFTPRQSYHFLSNLPHTHLFKHAMIFRISSTLLPSPCITRTNQVRTCYIAIRNRSVTYNLYAAVIAPLLLFTTLLRPCRILPAGRPPRAKDNLRNGGTPFERKKEEEKKSKKRGEGHPTVDFPDDFTSWRDFTESCT